MTNPFVSINKRMVHNKGEAECRGFRNDVGIEIGFIKGEAGLIDCGFQCPHVTNAHCAAGTGNDRLVQFKYLDKCKLAHQANRL